MYYNYEESTCWNFFGEPLFIILWLCFDGTVLYCIVLLGGFTILSTYPCVFSIAVSHAKCDHGLMDKAYNTDVAYCHSLVDLSVEIFRQYCAMKHFCYF